MDIQILHNKLEINLYFNFYANNITYFVLKSKFME